MRIDGHTRLIAHVGHPTTSFKAPLIYNPFFADRGLNVAVVPFGLPAKALVPGFGVIMRLTNVMGALITMPHKLAVVPFLDTVSTRVMVAGACNAVRILPDGRLEGDMFDGEGFVLSLTRAGRDVSGASALIVGAGGVGSAIAASLAGAGVTRLALFDTEPGRAEALAARLRAHHPRLVTSTGSNEPAGHDLAVNATPLGMKPDDPLPFDVARLGSSTLVGEVVLSEDVTPLVHLARERGCPTRIGLDMLFEQIPAYLDFFGLPTTTAEHLRALSGL